MWSSSIQTVSPLSVGRCYSEVLLEIVEEHDMGSRLSRSVTLLGLLFVASLATHVSRGAELPVCASDRPSGVFTVNLSESAPDCQIKSTAFFFGNIAICEGAVNAGGTDCAANVARSDVIAVSPIFPPGGGLPNATEYIICSDQNDGDQVDNMRPGACNDKMMNGMTIKGIFSQPTTLAFREAPGETGNPVTRFRSPAQMPGGLANGGQPYTLTDTPEPATALLVGSILLLLVALTRRRRIT